ncbi:MmyB family transcriptional regulator [Nocardia thailandica]
MCPASRRRLHHAGLDGAFHTVRRLPRKRIPHPEVGAVDLSCEVLLTPEADLRVRAFLPLPGTDASEKLALLQVIGTQSFAQYARCGQAHVGRRLPVAGSRSVRPIGGLGGAERYGGEGTAAFGLPRARPYQGVLDG